MQREELHLQELGIATLTSCFINANRDPKKGEPAKPSDFFYFTPAESNDLQIPSSTADAFFALADTGKLPGWCVAMSPVSTLVKLRTSTPCKASIWVGEGVALINPTVRNGIVYFCMGFVESHGQIITSGGVVRVPEMPECWILDGQFAIVEV